MDVLLPLRGELRSRTGTTTDASLLLMITPPDVSAGRCPAG
jgi:hypothetical protein